MPMVQITPTNRGGGNKRKPPSARFGADGQLSLSHAAAELLGEPQTVLLFVAEGAAALRLTPATSNDRGAWMINGGGIKPASIKAVTLAKARPDLVGSHRAELRADGLHLYPDTSRSAPTVDRWRAVLPSAANQRREQSSQALAPARITETGALVLAGEAVTRLGEPDHLLIFADVATLQLRVQPATAADPTAWRLTGAGVVQRRVSLTTLVKTNPTLVGEYTIAPAAHGLLLRRK